MKLSRRTLLSGLATTPLILRRARAASPHIAIIGAGAAGLAAAKVLKAANISFDLIEARDRIGGRAFTDTLLGARFDAGAFYIHWAERNPWGKIAQDLAVPVIDDRLAEGEFRLAEDGHLIPRGQSGRRRLAFSTFSQAAEAHSTEAGDLSLAAMAAELGGEEIAGAARAIALGALGEEPERVSLADYNRLDSGSDLVVPSGYGALVARYGADVEVRLSTQVSLIDWSGQGVAIETNRGRLAADAAIVTVPLGVLLAGRVGFRPELPAALQAAINGLQMGAYTKIALRFDQPDGFGMGVNSTLVTRHGGASILHSMWPHGERLVVSLIGGDAARDLAGAGEEAAIEAMLQQLTEAFGPEVRASFLGGRLISWWIDPFALGSYSIAWPGHADARAALTEPVAERIYFAGEACAGRAAMTVGGATLSGTETANRLLKAPAKD